MENTDKVKLLKVLRLASEMAKAGHELTGTIGYPSLEATNLRYAIINFDNYFLEHDKNHV